MVELLCVFAYFVPNLREHFVCTNYQNQTHKTGCVSVLCARMGFMKSKKQIAFVWGMSGASFNVSITFKWLILDRKYPLVVQTYSWNSAKKLKNRLYSWILAANKFKAYIFVPCNQDDLLFLCRLLYIQTCTKCDFSACYLSTIVFSKYVRVVK